MANVIVMFGTAGFGWLAGFCPLSPVAVSVASTLLTVPSIQPNRLDSGARG